MHLLALNSLPFFLVHRVHRSPRLQLRREGLHEKEKADASFFKFLLLLGHLCESHGWYQKQTSSTAFDMMTIHVGAEEYTGDGVRMKAYKEKREKRFE